MEIPAHPAARCHNQSTTRSGVLSPELSVRPCAYHDLLGQSLVEASRFARAPGPASRAILAYAEAREPEAMEPRDSEDRTARARQWPARSPRI
jgi:hypothetical protein